ncbi:MAG: chromosome partitioning protein ParA [Hyphomicrobiales bacterium]|nr:MAG: chromosome partitioning protein ParA [Hyphomicrobiales bacterium]
MQIIAIIGQKGGTGKTTTAIGLAVAAERAGYRTAILDLDPQSNAANWKDRRQADGPAVESIQPGRLRQTLKAAEDAGANYIFIDTPGKSDTAAVDAARAADLVLIPVRPQIFDLETLSAVRDALRIAGSPPAYVLLNGIHPSATRSPTEQRDVIGNAFGLPVCPVHLSHRATFAEAPTTGQAPQETEPNGKAAAELEALFAFVDKAALNMPAQKKLAEARK